MNSILRLAYNSFEYIRKKKRLNSPPMQLSIEPTNICNFRCTFCPQSNPDNRSRNRGKMSLEQCKSILKRAINDFYPDPRNRKISFTHDGEPFMNQQFIEFLKIAARLKYIIKFASNGYLAKKELIDSLISSRVRFNICVDFTSDIEIFEKYRGFKGSFEIVYQNLRYLIAKAKETGLIFVDVCDISSYYISEPTELDARFFKLQELFNDLNSTRVSFSKRIFHSMAGTVSLPSPGKLDRRKYRLCPYPWFNMNISWCGDVVPCCRDLTSKTVLGNVFEVDSLWKIWNSPDYYSLREALINGKPQSVDACRGCELPYDSTRWTPTYMINAVKSRLLRYGRK